jgi:nucleoside-diphosphate-sugar epimerase
VKLSTALLKNSVRAYLFTSSTGVFYPYLKRGVDESTPPHDLADPKDGSEKFGTDKAQCERETQRVFGDRAIVVRPTYIVGPGDTSDRFPYWPQRLAKAARSSRPVVATIRCRSSTCATSPSMVRLLENKKTGIYNVAGPKTALTARSSIRAAQALKADVKFTYVDDYDFLAAHKSRSRFRGRCSAATTTDDVGEERSGDRRQFDVSPAGDHGARHACLVAHRPRGAPTETALLHHTGEGGAGTGRLARPREVAARE